MKAMNGYVKYGQSPVFTYETWNNKFPKEKVNFENEDYLIHFDGFIVNGDRLKEQHNCENNCEVLCALFKEYGARLVCFAKGLYSLVIWDKKNATVLITNDLLSKRSMYYRIFENSIYYASSYHDLLSLLKDAEYSLEVNSSAVQAMIENGYLTGNQTYAKDVFYLDAFESIVVDLNNNCAQVVTHEMKKFEMPENEDEIIDMFDKFFSDAVSGQFEMNSKYGYKQCATISGGMDSRACLLKGVKNGYKDVLCINYANANSLDCTIAQDITTSLGLELVYYPMDCAVFINRLAEAMYCNECQQAGIGSTAARTMATLLNTDSFGLINIGICGGELMGDLIQEKKAKQDSFVAFSKIRQVLMPDRTNPDDYFLDKKALFDILRGSQNFPHMFVDKCEAISPFMDEDVFTFVLQIKPNLLFRRAFYVKWMKKHLPNTFTTTYTGAKFDSSGLVVVFNKVKFKLQNRLMGKSRADMNPIDYWFKTHPEYIKNCTDEYNANIEYTKQIGIDKEIIDLFAVGWSRNWLGKLYVLTALQGIKDIH